MKALILLLLFLNLPNIFAEEEISAFQKYMNAQRDINSRESIVDIDGVKYRKLEIEGKAYYFSFLEQERGKLEYFCGRPNGAQEKMVSGSVKYKRRKLAYIDLVTAKCRLTDRNQKVIVVDVEPEIGIHIFNKPNDVIKNKKVGIDLPNPTKLNFSGEF